MFIFAVGHLTTIMENERTTGYNVKRLIPPSTEIKGKLLPYQDKVVFEPDEEYAGKIVIPIAKIKDVRLAKENDIDALRVLLAGLLVGVLWQKTHDITHRR
jgi:hypothetical protein